MSLQLLRQHRRVRQWKNVKVILQKKYGDQTDAYMAAVRQAYPNTSKPFEYNDIEFGFRSLAIKQADQKSGLRGAAPVYMYLFTWQSPVNDGRYKAMHCMDIAFQFDNIRRCEEMTGGGKDAYTLASKISSAWISFARLVIQIHRAYLTGLPTRLKTAQR